MEGKIREGMYKEEEQELSHISKNLESTQKSVSATLWKVLTPSSKKRAKVALSKMSSKEDILN